MCIKRYKSVPYTQPKTGTVWYDAGGDWNAPQLDRARENIVHHMPYRVALTPSGTEKRNRDPIPTTPGLAEERR